MESLITTFHIDWKIIIAQVINFAIVFFVFYLFALKPLKKMMDERAEKINRGITDARANAEIIEKTKSEYDRVISQARADAQELFQKEKREAEIKRSQMLESAKREVDSLILSGQKALQDEKQKIIEEAKGEIVTLAMQAAEKILAKKSDMRNI